MTLQEIAKWAKVSTATVSRTINRIPTVDPVLARRVWRVIEQVGYYPNSHARTLVSGRSRIFGLIVPEITNPFFPEIVQTLTELGVKHQYEVLLSFLAQDASTLENAARQMTEHRVDGVAILTFGREHALIRCFRASKCARVCPRYGVPGTAGEKCPHRLRTRYSPGCATPRSVGARAHRICQRAGTSKNCNEAKSRFLGMHERNW